MEKVKIRLEFELDSQKLCLVVNTILNSVKHKLLTEQEIVSRFCSGETVVVSEKVSEDTKDETTMFVAMYLLYALAEEEDKNESMKNQQAKEEEVKDVQSDN